VRKIEENSTGFQPRAKNKKRVLKTKKYLKKRCKMSNSYCQIFLHFVFAVKYRDAIIKKEWRPQLLAVVGNLINETGSKNVITNGIEDHMHCLVDLHPSIAPAKLMQSVKAKSSKWVNESGILTHRFEWQVGYGAFSCSKEHTNNVIKYIQNQEAHHKRENFIQEQKLMLIENNIYFKDDYLFGELE